MRCGKTVIQDAGKIKKEWPRAEGNEGEAGAKERASTQEGGGKEKYGMVGSDQSLGDYHGGSRRGRVGQRIDNQTIVFFLNYRSSYFAVV